MLFSPHILVRNQPRAVTSSAYVGPGDVVSGAYAWFGLRGYTAAYSTGSNPCVDLVDQAGNNPLTANILSNGRLDVASISSWVTANSVSTIKVTKLYDQSGNARHIVQATLANMPALNLTGFGSLPAIVFTAANSHYLQSSSNFTVSQPITASSVFNRASASIGQEFFGFGVDVSLFQSSSNTIALMVAGSAGSPTASATDGSWHAIQGVVNGASSTAYVDGSTTSITAGTSGVSSRPIKLAGPPYVSNYWGGSVAEVGLWMSGFNATQAGDMNTNQHGTNGHNF